MVILKITCLGIKLQAPLISVNSQEASLKIPQSAKQKKFKKKYFYLY